MKLLSLHKIIVVFFLINITCIFNHLKAQDASVKKSIYSAQAGLIGVWVNNESRLQKSIALRSEIGLNFDYYSPNFYGKGAFVAIPNIDIEPRYYYNLNSRSNNGHSIKNNSADFFTIKINYYINQITLSNAKYMKSPNDISGILKWGIRRNLGKEYNYEIGFGVGLLYNSYYQSSNFDYDIHVRIGMNIKK